MKMLLPPNWDSPSADNVKRCDEFEKRSHIMDKDVLKYRFHEPKGNDGKRYPLVLYLHGADAAGDDNALQLSMHDIGTFLVREDIKRRYPCYILAPQYGLMKHWAMPDIKAMVLDLVDETVSDHPDIDRQRIYIYGYSAGGVGTLRFIKERPDFFAAALSICGATGGWDLDNLLRTPLYLVHAADDMIVKSTYREGVLDRLGNLGSADLYLKFKGIHKELEYTEYPAGWMEEQYGVNPHCSWVAVSDTKNIKIWDWLFSKRLKGDTDGIS